MQILIINQYFPPDRSATAILLGQLAEDLSKTYQVTVICGSPTYAPEQFTEKPTQLNIIRIPLIKLPRSNLFIRIFNYFIFVFGATFQALFRFAPSIVVCWTDPPIIGLIGALLKLLNKSSFVFVSQDVYPEIAIAAKKMNNPISLRLLKFASQTILKIADAVVVVGRDMEEILVAKGCLKKKLYIIQNWQDLESLKPCTTKTFRQTHQIPEHTFVVMHSGNIGYSQDIKSLLKTAELTKNEKDILYLIVGDGSQKSKLVQWVQYHQLSNVRILPYQPSSVLSESLSAADLHYVSLKPALTGYIVPSKIYGILSVARPILANVSLQSEIAYIVQKADCGILSSSDPMILSKHIIEMSRSRDQLKKWGNSGRQWIETNGGRKKALQAYQSLLTSLMRPI